MIYDESKNTVFSSLGLDEARTEEFIRDNIIIPSQNRELNSLIAETLNSPDNSESLKLAVCFVFGRILMKQDLYGAVQNIFVGK
jgi:hypothetical protein